MKYCIEVSSQERQLYVREVVNKMLQVEYSDSKSVDEDEQEQWDDTNDAPKPINVK